MATHNNTPGEEIDSSRNDTAGYGDDTIGENTGDSGLEQDAEKQQHYAKKDTTKDTPAPDIKTVVPDNDN